MSGALNIFTHKDLEKHTINTSVQSSITIRGEHLKTLGEITTINGTLGISDSSLESLGNLREVLGNLWISSRSVYMPLSTLGKLEMIKGDASFRYSNISNLGCLTEVQGNLSLRDTLINDLGQLKKVWGNLYLPKRIEKSVDISEIEVNGKIKFWNDSKTFERLEPTHNIDLIKYHEKVPYWQHEYIFSNNKISNCELSIQRFYTYFKSNFLKGKFIDLEGNSNYAFTLFYDLLNKFSESKNLSKQLSHLGNFYPKTKPYVQKALIEKIELNRNFEDSWNLIRSKKHINYKTIVDYQQKLNRSLLDGELMIKMAGFRHLTAFGISNIKQIIPFAKNYLSTYEKENKDEFFNLFIRPSHSIDNAEYFRKFYLSDSEYEQYLRFDKSQIKSGYRSKLNHLVEKAIFSQCRYILKKAEDLFREEIGMPKVGEGWISETELYYKISNSFEEHEVVQHASPKWLGRQHLDIYFPKLNIGIEYQGAQHYKPIDFFGGQDAFEKTKERDRIKKEKCKANSCALIIVDEGYNIDTVLAEIRTIIKSVQSSSQLT